MIKKKEPQREAIKLQVVEALQEDAYKGIVRIDPTIMKKLGLERGDIVFIEGGRQAYSIVDRAYPADLGESIIRMDGIASVILDKYMEFLGATTFGLIGLFLLFITPNISIGSRFLLLGIIFGSIFILGSFYHRLIKNKPVFFSLFSLFLSRKRLKKFSKNLKEVDKKMTYFVTHHKREFFLSYAFYFISAVIFIMEFKYLLLSFGVSITLLQLILVIIVLGIASYIPLPMALGSLEAGQSGIFQLLMNDGSIGLALSLIHRVKSLAFSAIGIILIFLFGGKEFFKKDR